MSIAVIDLGFLYLQGIVNDNMVMMKSVVGEGKKLRFRDLDMSSKDNTDDVVVRMEGAEYFVSDLAINQSDSVVHSLKANRFDTLSTQVLLNATLGMAYGSGNHLAYFVSGLPVSHYSEYKQNIKDLFMKDKHEYDIVINGTDHIRGSVTPVDGRFIPQPFGAGMDRILDTSGNIENRDLATKTMAIIDIGFGTTDIYVMNSLSPIERLTFSTPTAMNHAYKLIADKIEENFGVSYPLYKLEQIVRNRKFHKNGKEYDMTAVVQWAYSSTANQLLSEIVNKWKNMHEIDEIFLAGGGGIALAPFILPEFENIELILDSQWAVVRGYHKWAKRTWKNVAF